MLSFSTATPVPWDDAITRRVPLTSALLHAGADALPGINVIIVNTEEVKISTGTDCFFPLRMPLRTESAPILIHRGHMGTLYEHTDTGVVYTKTRNVECHLLSLRSDASVRWIPFEEIPERARIGCAAISTDQLGVVCWAGAWGADVYDFSLHPEEYQPALRTVRAIRHSYGTKPTYNASHYIMCYAEDEPPVCK
jgi:hypothetical protein